MADLSQTAANVGVSGSTGSISIVQAGEAITQGQPVFLNAGDSKYYQCDADLSSTAAGALGIAMTPAASDGYFIIATSGVTVDLGATLTVGETYVCSATKGGVAPIGDLGSGDYVTSLGVASAADAILLDINASGIPKP